MDRKLSILLVEDDPNACKDIIEYIEELDDTTLIGVTNNSTKAIDYIHDYLPDAVILDLELHQGSGNGLFVLQALQQLLLEVPPYILITTNNSSPVTYETARQMGADFIMSKHQEDYSAKTVVEFLRMMKTIIRSREKSVVSASSAAEPPEMKIKRIQKRIYTELNQIGISPKAIGYQYLTDAIQLLVEKPTNNLCSILGQKYGKTESSVERAMQNAITKAWRSSDIEDLLTYYTAKINSDKGVPTMTEFIYYYASKLKNEY
jgi:DNA-binding NarL/FixJ family response regulator